MRELVCNGQLWARAKTASQLQGRTARSFSSNSLVKTMEMTAATQSFGSQDYCKKSRMTILGLVGVLFYRTSRHKQNGLSYVPKKILIWMLREARGVLKATVCNTVQPDYHFIHIGFCSSLFLSARALCSLAGYAQKQVSTYWRLYA